MTNRALDLDEAIAAARSGYQYTTGSDWPRHRARERKRRRVRSSLRRRTDNNNEGNRR